jgi:hypothetical protein
MLAYQGGLSSMELSSFTENIRKIFDLRKLPRTTSDEPARSSEMIALDTIIMSASSMAEDSGLLRPIHV